MPIKKYITATSVIDHGIIYKDGKPVFENKNEPFHHFADAAYKYFDMGYPKFHKMDNLSKLGLLAADVLLNESFKKENYQSDEVGIVLSNSNSSLDTDVKYYKTVSSFASPALFVYTLPNIVIGEICIKNNFKGENAFFVFKEFDATFIASYVNSLFDRNIIQASICGWVELMEEKYKAVLLLVEKHEAAQSIVFSEENINKIYSLDNG